MMKKSFGGKSPPSHWQTVCGFNNDKSKQTEGATTDGDGEQREPVFSLEPSPEMQANQVPYEQPPAAEPEGDPPDNEPPSEPADHAPATQADGSPV